MIMDRQSLPAEIERFKNLNAFAKGPFIYVFGQRCAYHPPMIGSTTVSSSFVEENPILCPHPGLQLQWADSSMQLSGEEACLRCSEAHLEHLDDM